MIKYQIKFFGRDLIAFMLSHPGRDASCRGYVV